MVHANNLMQLPEVSEEVKTACCSVEYLAYPDKKLTLRVKYGKTDRVLCPQCKFVLQNYIQYTSDDDIVQFISYCVNKDFDARTILYTTVTRDHMWSKRFDRLQMLAYIPKYIGNDEQPAPAAVVEEGVS